jgi:flagellar basal body-associated protein FliL
MADKTAPNSQEVQKKRKKKPPIKQISLIAVFAFVSVFAVFYFVKYNDINTKYQEAILTTDEKNKRTAAEVAKLIDLPKDETPIVYIVKDKEKLTTTKASKEFFEKAKNDDIVLAFQKGDIAVIYRSGEKRIVKTDTYQKFVAASTPISIAIIVPADRQAALIQQLESKFANIQITGKSEPKVSNGQSYIVDLSGTNAKTAQDLATQIGLSVGTLPEGEAKPTGALFAIVISP